MLPFYFPTTTLVIDDDPVFLESFRFRFGDQFACETSSEPDKAAGSLLRRVKSSAFLDSFSDIALVAPNAGPEPEPTAAMRNRIARLVANPFRYDQISVVVVDFDMPGFNGVQFCRSIANLPIRKLMLTGKATDEMAVNAFNEGAIDYFLKKEDPALDQHLERQIAALQHRYFRDGLRTGSRLPGAGMPPFLADEDLDATIESFRQALRTTEYYLSADPAGMLLIDGAGAVALALISDDAALEAHKEIAEAQGAPQALLDVIKARGVVPWFPTPGGFYEQAFARSWAQFVYPVRTVVGRSWYVALVQNDRPRALLPDGAVFGPQLQRRQSLH